jgi:hypothetical protein
MADDQANSNEGGSPANDIAKQNPGETTVGDMTGEATEDRAGAGEGPDAGLDGRAHDEEQTKTQDLAKAGRSDFNPNDSQE